MFGLIIICLIIYAAAYYCIVTSGQPIEVRAIQSFDDYFIQANEEIHK